MMRSSEQTIVYRGATVVDGTGGVPFTGDVVVAAGRIQAVSSSADRLVGTAVDAGGLFLAPGFIDIHGHSDLSLLRHPGAESKVLQGVTLEVAGNCGLSAFPVNPSRQRTLAEYLAMHEFSLPEGTWPWSDFRSYADWVDALHPGMNIALLVGHAALRIAAMGMQNSIPSPRELRFMERLLSDALEQGAWGMSTGLIYPPGSFSETDELTTLARVVSEYGGLCTSHIRGEGAGLLAAIDEAIAVAQKAGTRMQVSHLKAIGKENVGMAAEALRRLAAARDAGIDIFADQYPYDASSTSLTAVLPDWCHEGGVEAMLRRLVDPDVRERLEDEIRTGIAKREGAAGIMVASCKSPTNKDVAGMSLADIATLYGCPPETVVVKLLIEERGEVPAIFFSMADEDVDTILRSPDVAIGSDGHGLDAALAEGGTHPRSYGCFPRVLGRYVREKNVLDVARAVYKMTGLPASRLGLPDRGAIRAGYVADLVLFDPETVIDTADYLDPHRYPVGIVHVILEGGPVVRDGHLTGERRGRVLRRPCRERRDRR